MSTMGRLVVKIRQKLVNVVFECPLFGILHEANFDSSLSITIRFKILELEKSNMLRLSEKNQEIIERIY